MSEDRDMAMASRREGDGTRIDRYTREQKKLQVGTGHGSGCANQTGKSPTNGIRQRSAWKTRNIARCW